MKRLFLLIVITIFFTSCTRFPLKNEQNYINKEQQNLTKHSISDYYPFTEDTRMQYEGVGNEYAEKTVYVDYIKGNRMQLRVINPGTILGQVLEYKDGELRLIASVEEFYDRDDLTSYKSSQPEILLKEPLEVGTSWTLPNGNKRYISSIDADVAVPYGHFKALEVTTEGADYKTLDYYVLNIGHIKTVFKSNGTTVETNLEKMDKNAPVVQTIRIYYPDFSNNRTVYVKNKVSFRTNDDIKNVFEEYFKTSPGKNIPKLMSSDTKINRLYLNRAENKVYVDFSREFISEMNAGAALESLIIQSVTNTFGDYYNVDKVYITIGGSPYSSGHIQIKENEPFYVNYKNVREYK